MELHRCFCFYYRCGLFYVFTYASIAVFLKSKVFNLGALK